MSLIDPVDLSQLTIPKLIPQNEITRESVLNTIELKFRSESVIVLNGEEDVGKTTICSQFVNKIKKHCLALFVNGDFSYSFHENNLLVDLYRQVFFYLNSKECEKTTVPPEQLKEIFYKLGIALRRDNETIYIVLDGFENIPSSSFDLVGSFFSNLPFATPNFKFLISSNSELARNTLKSIEVSPIEVSAFTLPETEELLKEHPANRDEIIQIYELVSGSPVKLYSVKRLLSSGIGISNILDEYTEDTLFLIEKEWLQASSFINQFERVFSIVAFSKGPLTLRELEMMAEVSQDDLRSLISECSILTDDSDTIKYTTQSLFKYSQHEFREIRRETLKLILKFYNDKATNGDLGALVRANSYNESLGDYPAIISHLTNSNIAEMFRQTNSLNQALQQVMLGKSAALEVDSLTELLRLGNLQSVLADYKTPQVLESEIQCYLLEEDYDAAINLASSSRLIEERLSLQAMVASSQYNEQGSVSDKLKSLIDEQVKQVNSEILGLDKTVDLASNLFPAFPQHALKLINDLSAVEQGGGNKSDYAFFLMSVKTLSRNKQGLDLLIEHTSNNDARKLDSVKMLNLFKNGTPSSKILSKLADFDNSDAILILRNWLSNGNFSSDSLVLAEHLMTLILSTPEYHANATIYSDIIKLLSALNIEDGRKLVTAVVPKISALSNVGPSYDYFKVVVQITKFELENNLPLSFQLNLFNSIKETIEDKAARISALLLILPSETCSLLRVNKDELEEEVELLIDSLLRDTAEHISMLEPLLKKMAHINFFKAIKWTQKANTQIRRDALLHTLIKTSYQANINLPVKSLISEVRKIKDIDLRSDAIRLFFKFCLTKDVSKSRFEDLRKLRNKCKHNFLKTLLNTYLIKIIYKNKTELSKFLDKTKVELKASWEGVVGDWSKINSAFIVHNELYELDRELANKYKTLAITLRKETVSINKTLLSSYFYSLDLITRVIYEFQNRKLNADDDIQVLLDLMEQIPNHILKLKAFSRLASAFYLNKEAGEFEKIVRNKIIPTMEEFGNEYTKEFAAAFEVVSPIIFCFSQNVFQKKLEILQSDPVVSDSIIEDVFYFKIRKKLLFDPYKAVENKHLDVHPDELEDYLYLISLLKEDSKIYHLMEIVLNHALSRRNICNFTKAQLESFKNTIELTVNDKLGNEKYIVHDGYKICCRALNLKIVTDKSLQSWQALVDEAYLIPCCSDKVFTLGQLICLIPPQFSAKKRALLKECCAFTKQIPSKVEQLNRAEYIINIGQDIDLNYIKLFIKEVISIRQDEENGEFNKKRLELLDSVYSMDDTFAGSLSSIFDNDPARKKAIENNIEKKKKSSREKKSLSFEDKAIADSEKITKYADIFWENLGQLNASNHTPNRKQNLNQLICSISNHGLTKVYPILSYLIHAIGTTTISPAKNNLEENLTPFLKSLLGCAIQFSEMFDLAKPDLDHDISSDHLIVDESNYQKGVKFISEWILTQTTEIEEPELFLVEPYFELGDLELLANVIDKDPNFIINILSSIERLNLLVSEHGELETAVKRYWKKNISNEEMPLIRFTFIGLESIKSQMPVHDRWWYVDKIGLDLGTSINGIGSMRLSMLKRLNYDQVITVQEKVGNYFTQSKRKVKNEKVDYKMIFIQ